MKVTAVGARELDFEDRRSGKPVQGIQLFYTAVNENVMGLIADKVFIRKDSKLFAKMKSEMAAARFVKPCAIDLDYQIVGSRGQSELVDIVFA